MFDFFKNTFRFGTDIGIDLGTSTVLVYVKGRGIVIREPSVVAVDKKSGKILKVGMEAMEMIGRTPKNIAVIKPLMDGVISDYESTEKMLKYFISKVNNSKLFKPRIVVCVPSSVTEVEQRAVIDATMHAGARSVYLIEEPIAAAIGAGIDISKPYGTMIVDIGGGTTDIAVISMGGVVTGRSVNVAGDKFDEAIKKYVRKKYNVAIGDRTAEEIKKQIGGVYFRAEPVSCSAKGRSLATGLPQTITLTSEEAFEALEEPISEICEAIHRVMEDTPPELIGDITTRGITLTGGSTALYGIDLLLQRETGIQVEIAPDAASCVAIGTGQSLDRIGEMNVMVNNKYRNTISL